MFRFVGVDQCSRGTELAAAIVAGRRPGQPRRAPTYHTGVSELAPVPPRERVAVLDVLRGFAMLGVLLANLYELYSLRFTLHGEPPGGLLDRLASAFIGIVVAGKAQTLLTFLFGFGFAAQLLRAQARHEPVMPLYLRRLFALLAIGWLHVLLLSWVDVTWGYAVTGFFLLPFLRCSNRTRVIVAFVCTVVPLVVYAIPGVSPAMERLIFDRPRGAYIADYAAAVHGGDRLAILHAHAVLAVLWALGGGVAWYLPWLLGRFLLGYVAGAQRWFDRDGADRLPLFHKLFGYGALVALPPIVLGVLARTGVLGGPHGIAVNLIFSLIGQLGLLGQVAMYVAIVVILIQRPTWRRLLCIVAPVGRMPLTTYLMQSLICTSLFYGWGLAWSTPPAAACVGLGFAIFALQIIISQLWLRWFLFGPAEWVWRTVVYWRLQPMVARR
jgi:uncharacterized protein